MWTAKAYSALLICAAVAAAIGCSSSKSKTAEATRASSSSKAASGDPKTHVDVMCIGDKLENPPGPFHYSFQHKDASGTDDREAEITPQTMDITTKDSTGAHSYHAVHSNETNWGSAVLVLSSLRLTAMSARLDSLNGTSALIFRGKEPVNGYDTVKYDIDTDKAGASDKETFRALFGDGAFEKGTVWVPADGCAVKLVLDEGLVPQPGTVNKEHYEIAMVKR
jgi:hypothetical protein